MEQICCKKNLGPGKGNKVLQVLRKMIATRFEKKSGIFKRGKRPSFKGQIISECPYEIIVYSNEKISEISALVSKERSNQKLY